MASAALRWPPPVSENRKRNRLLFGWGFIFRLGKYFLDPVVELAAGEQHPVTAGETFDPNIGAQANDLPFITATRVRLSQAQPVIKLKVREHVRIISHVIIRSGG